MADVGRALFGTAALLGGAALVESIIRTAGGSTSVQFVVFAWLLALATTLPLVIPRPTMAAGTITAASVLSLSVVRTLTVAGAIAQVIAAYRLGRRGAAPLATALAVPYILLALIEPTLYVRFVAILLAASAPTAALAGVVKRMSAEAAETEAAQRALAGTLLERTALGERARIARELHDVVAHHISMIAVQAETARLTTAGMPPAGAQQLSTIGDTARNALTEMRRLLGVLREDAATDPQPALRQPQPGLRQLNDLLDEARDATGAGTRLILHGAPVELDPGVELAAYRIIQEALTNARRHAPGAAVDVELHFTDVALHLLVRDNGPGFAASADVSGHGLLGMTERAAAVGGTLKAGPANGGGFLVKATLPAKEENE
jgi:signal transduction histidine kinase